MLVGSITCEQQILPWDHRLLNNHKSLLIAIFLHSNPFFTFSQSGLIVKVRIPTWVTLLKTLQWLTEPSKEVYTIITFTHSHFSFSSTLPFYHPDILDTESSQVTQGWPRFTRGELGAQAGTSCPALIPTALPAICLILFLCRLSLLWHAWKWPPCSSLV